MLKQLLLIASQSLCFVVPPSSASSQPARSHERAPGIPASVTNEHHELHAALAPLLKAGGKTGVAAAEVARLLHPHFVKEEEYAMPPLGALQLIGRGETVPNSSEIIAQASRLERDLPEMLREHQTIGAALTTLRKAGTEEGKTAAVQFADDLLAHAKEEEQILYPASILVGKYLAGR